MTDNASSRRANVPVMLLIAVLAIAMFLRFYRLGEWPMWLDEAYSTFGAEQSYRFIWTVLPTYETHPPFYTTILHTWTLLAGSSTFAMRLFGALAGIVSLGAIWGAASALARTTGRPAFVAGLLAVALASVSQTLVDISRLVRPYSLIILVYGLGIWAILKLAEGFRADGRLSRNAWLGYLTCQALLFWLHNLGALYVASLGLAMLILCGPVRLLAMHWRVFLIGHIAVLLAAAPAMLILFDQAPTWQASTWLRFTPERVPQQVMLILGLPGLFGVALTAFLAWNGARTFGKQGVRLTTALLVLTFLPMLFSILLSVFAAPVFLVRTLVGCAVPAILMVAAGANTGNLSRVCLAILMALSLQRSLAVQQGAPEDEWYVAADWVAQRIQPGDLVYAYPNEGALPFHYALRDTGKKATVREIPTPMPAHEPEGWYPAGGRGAQSLPDWRLQQIANDPLSRKTPTIWLMRIQRGIYDRNDTFLKILQQDRRMIAHYSQGSVNITGLRLSPQPAPTKKPKP